MQEVEFHAETIRAQRAFWQHQVLCSSSGNCVIFAATRRPSSRVSNLAADRRSGLFLVINIRKRLPAVVAHDKETRAVLRSTRAAESGVNGHEVFLIEINVSILTIPTI
jgi:hypothetical protein